MRVHCVCLCEHVCVWRGGWGGGVEVSIVDVVAGHRYAREIVHNIWNKGVGVLPPGCVLRAGRTIMAEDAALRELWHLFHERIAQRR